jgi:hypothetical protein
MFALGWRQWMALFGLQKMLKLYNSSILLVETLLILHVAPQCLDALRMVSVTCRMGNVEKKTLTEKIG